MLPNFKCDPTGNGGKVALSEAQICDPKAPKLDHTNSIPFDAAKVKEGDVLPGFILDTGTDGSADDIDVCGKRDMGDRRLAQARHQPE